MQKKTFEIKIPQVFLQFSANIHQFSHRFFMNFSCKFFWHSLFIMSHNIIPIIPFIISHGTFSLSQQPRPFLSLHLWINKFSSNSSNSLDGYNCRSSICIYTLAVCCSCCLCMPRCSGAQDPLPQLQVSFHIIQYFYCLCFRQD